MDLREFGFPIVERKVAVHDGKNRLIDLNDKETYLPGEYKSIVREDTNELISIVRESYQIVPNEQIISRLMEELDKIRTTFKIEPSHSFVENNRMRLQVSFPEIRINDGRSDIALSLFLHNSYDMSESVRMFFGAIRAICTNGMVFGKVLGSVHRRHTSGFQMQMLHAELSKMADLMPTVKGRITNMDSYPVSEGLKREVESGLGKKIAEQILQKKYESQWQLFNALTFHISHVIHQRHRARYQMAVSRIFGL